MQVLPGDIIGFLGNSATSRLICLGTGGWPYWPYSGLSHIGIVGQYERKNYLFEATTLCDLKCAIRGKRIKGTQAHRLPDRLETYNGRVWHYPLLEPLWPNQKGRLNKFLLSHLGHQYDRHAAFMASDISPSFIESYLHPEQRDAFCSFWCASAHANIGRFKTADLGRWSPNRFVKYQRKDGILGPPIRLK